MNAKNWFGIEVGDAEACVAYFESSVFRDENEPCQNRRGIQAELFTC